MLRHSTSKAALYLGRHSCQEVLTNDSPPPSSVQEGDSISTNILDHNVCVQLPSQPSDNCRHDKKRMNEAAAFETAERESKRRRRYSAGSENERIPIPDEIDSAGSWIIDEDQQWTDHVKRHTMSGEQQRGVSWERSASRTDKYEQSVSSGDPPWAWTARHQEEMAFEGIILHEDPEITMTAKDQELCDLILNTEQSCPDEWSFRQSTMLQVVAAAEPRNEARVVRDITPYFFPAPELERLRGHTELEHIAEGLGVSWTKCTTWCGPVPKPDGTHSISRSFFSKEEIDKLPWNNTSACEGGMFPFYVCEAQIMDHAEKAKRQATHSASIAAKTIIELYEQSSAAHELNRRVLAFSIAHTHRTAEICAHFPVIDGEKHTFHRKLLRVVDLTDAAADWKAGYRIAFGIWRHFFPKHLKRVRDGLSRQHNHRMASFTAWLGLGEDVASTSVSMLLSNRPSLSLTAKMQEENARLQERVQGLMERLEQQLEHQRQVSQRREALELQLAEQQKQQAELQEQQAELQKQQAEQQAEQLKQQASLIELLMRRQP